jgi:hypothetical protein
MMEKMNEALEELKRVDHLIYVSLKYTRTVDVIINILGRMIDGYSLMVDVLLEHAREKGISFSEPESAVERAEIVRAIYSANEPITDNMDLYLLLRKVLRSRNVLRENEYRRHVTMKTVVDGREEIVNIDIITNYYLFQRDFLFHVRGIVEGKVDVPLVPPHAGPALPPGWSAERGDDEPARERDQQQVVHRTPPKRSTIKVRPVGSPPRKRAPRPKKYKIQIPKGKNSITLPYEYDPHFRKELEKERARLKAEEVKNAKKPVKKEPKKKPSLIKRIGKAVRSVAKGKRKK